MVTCSPVGGFKYFLFSPLFSEKIPILTHIFPNGLIQPPASSSGLTLKGCKKFGLVSYIS